MLDLDGRIVSWNSGAEHIKGYQAKKILGQHFSCFFSAEDIKLGLPEQELRIACALGRFEDEGWRIRKDGSQFWANVVITALYDRSGELRGFSKVTRDITSRKRAEEEIHKALAREKELNELKSRFVSMTSHEFRTPLSTILSSTELLEYYGHF